MACGWGAMGACVGGYSVPHVHVMLPHLELKPKPACVCVCTQNLPLWQKAVAGLTAGGLGALVGTPADLTLIRLQADSTLPEAQKRHYKGVGDALVR